MRALVLAGALLLLATPALRSYGQDVELLSQRELLRIQSEASLGGRDVTLEYIRGLEILERELRERSRVNELRRQGRDGIHRPDPKVPPEVRALDFPDLIAAITQRHSVIWDDDDQIAVGPIPKSNELPKMGDENAPFYPNARRVVAVVGCGNIKQGNSNTCNGDYTEGADWTLASTTTYGEYNDLCSGQPNFNKPVIAECSGFLIASNKVATAAHCISAEEHLGSFKFVFGFTWNGTTPKTVIADSDVYSGVSLSNVDLDLDYTIVELNDDVADRTPALYRTAGKVPDDAKLYVIGHPGGLPMTRAGDATILDNSFLTLFRSTLDSFGGNSGSLVANQGTHLVEGMFIEGDGDYEIPRGRLATTPSGCRIIKHCDLGKCTGQDSRRIMAVSLGGNAGLTGSNPLAVTGSTLPADPVSPNPLVLQIDETETQVRVEIGSDVYAFGVDHASAGAASHTLELSFESQGWFFSDELTLGEAKPRGDTGPCTVESVETKSTGWFGWGEPDVAEIRFTTSGAEGVCTIDADVVIADGEDDPDEYRAELTSGSKSVGASAEFDLD